MDFTSKQIEEEIGLKTNTLHYYIKDGAITPEIDTGSGTGTKRLFSEKNVMEAAILKHLIDIGFPKKFILKFFKSMNESGEAHKLEPRKIFAEHKIVYIIFYLYGGKSKFEVHTSVASNSKVESFKDISDEEFFRALTKPRSFEFNVVLEEWCDLFSIINLSSILMRYIHLFDLMRKSS